MNRFLTSSLLVLTTAFFPSLTAGMEIHVGLYYQKSLSSILFSASEGCYLFYGDGQLLDTIQTHESVYLSVVDDYVSVNHTGDQSGLYRQVYFGDMNDNGEFLLRPIDGNLEARSYHGHISFVADLGGLKMINRIELEKYIAAVVEAESGNQATLEFYKAQAVICRTYALKHLSRHASEGYHLCDDVHCQVYKGKLKDDPVIAEAAQATRSLVIIDRDSVLITGAFHANCGGQTVNSEDVWLQARPYLRSVTDPYCVVRNNRTWERKIGLDEWRNYLIKTGFDSGTAVSPPSAFRFLQEARTYLYTVRNHSIPFARIRNDWGFRSAFFSVDHAPGGSEIIIRGKGYGHGVGMCQEGAMQMSEEGKLFGDIIIYYFTDVTVTEFERLPPFRE
jgi:stage II sporulation protein D